MIAISHSVFLLHLSAAQLSSALTTAAISGYTVVGFNADDPSAIYIEGNRELTSAEMTALASALNTNAGVTGITVTAYSS